MKYWYFLNVWQNSPVKPWLYFVGSFKIIHSVFLLVIGLGLISLSFWVSVSTLCVSRNVSVSSTVYRYALKNTPFFLFLISTKSAVILVIFVFSHFFLGQNSYFFQRTSPFGFIGFSLLLFSSFSFSFCYNIYYVLSYPFFWVSFFHLFLIS